MNSLRVLFLSLAVCCVAAAPPLRPSTTIDEYVRELNITLEHHYVVTEDGYILHLHRLVNPGKPVVFLQHGILASSWCWLVNEPTVAPAVVLYNAGYDVWLGNSRGNRYSTNHTTLSTHSKEFWNFTFDEMARFDVPAVVNYVSELPTTKDGKFPYVGWSQATTAFFAAGMDTALGSMLSKKIKIFVALSPVTYLVHSGSVLLDVLSKFHLSEALMKYFPYGILDGSAAEDAFEELICKLTFGELCKVSVDAVCGCAPTDSKKQIERLVTHFPAGTSVKDFNQYNQFLESSPPFFGYYNYTEEQNLEKYGQRSAPQFNISNFNLGIPVAFFRGDNDLLVASKDFERFRAKFPNSTVVHERVYRSMSHVSWYVATENIAKVYLSDLLQVIE